MRDFIAGKFYPPNPNSRVWKGGRFVDSVTTTGIAPTAQGGIAPTAQGRIRMSDVDGLEAALSAKSDVGHQHSVSDVHPTPLVHTDIIDGGTFF